MNTIGNLIWFIFGGFIIALEYVIASFLLLITIIGIPFGLQGLLYLSDTDENQGAFTVIPGFHKNIENWLENLNDDENPRDINLLNDYKKKHIAAKAGDFIIWNQCLPHGSSPNTSDKPRIVQYINYQPIDLEYQAEWI